MIKLARDTGLVVFFSLFYLVTDVINVLQLKISQPCDEDCARIVSNPANNLHILSIKYKGAYIYDVHMVGGGGSKI